MNSIISFVGVGGNLPAQTRLVKSSSKERRKKTSLMKLQLRKPLALYFTVPDFDIEDLLFIAHVPLRVHADCH